MPRFAKRAAAWVGSLLANLALLAASLLPLSALLILLPAILPGEAVLSDTTRPARSRSVGLLRRAASLCAGLTVLIALVAVSLEAATRLPLPDSGYFADLITAVLPGSLVATLPADFVRLWPYVILGVYFTDLAFLLALGRVPLRYNVRNLVVRWRVTALTALAFAVVIALLVSLLAFANGMYRMTQSGHEPGNVVVLSEGATDELFSGLGPPNVVEEMKFARTPDGVGVKESDAVGHWFSPETFFVVTQPRPESAGGDGPRVRFLSVRGVYSPKAAAAVHNVQLASGDWWGAPGDGSAYFAVLGEGVAGTLGEDYGKPRLGVSDEFDLGGRRFRVAGVMAGGGSTQASEIWVGWSVARGEFRKESITTAVLRAEGDTEAAAARLADYLGRDYKRVRVTALTERAYFDGMGAFTDVFLYAILVIVAVMAVGGVFGVMNTMYAAVAQRLKDVGVLRILGFKRWQVLVSFLLESLLIGLAGGVAGGLIGRLAADGRTASSILSGGEGSAKFVVLTMNVDSDVLICGLLFTMVMARLGGLLPALSGMRQSILDAVR